MITAQPNPNKPYFRLLIAVVVCALAFVLCLAFSSCSSIKDMGKTSSTSVEVETKDSSEYWKQLYSTYKSKTEYEQSEMNSSLSFQQQTTDALLDAFTELQTLYTEKDLSADSLNKRIRKVLDSFQKVPCKSTLEVDNKGNIKATGVKSFDIELLLSKITVDLYKDSLSTERNLRVAVEKAAMKTQQVKTVYKKKSFLSQWWLWLIFFLGGLVLGFKLCWKYKDSIIDLDKTNAT